MEEKEKKREEEECLFEARMDHGFEKGILTFKVQHYTKLNGKEGELDIAFGVKRTMVSRRKRRLMTWRVMEKRMNENIEE
eukprot:8331754-Ditylum_brightwellii.AAC.1